MRPSPFGPTLCLERLQAIGTADSLGGRLVLVRQVGAGGMGRVYEATDGDDGPRLAVKLIHDDRGDAYLARFTCEAEILESLHHPAIVSYVGHGTTSEGDHYLAMDWLDGENLGRRLARGRLSVAQTATLGRRIVQGLAAAHRAGVIHRDLKPSNIVLVNGDVARATLVDFGIAHRSGVEALTRTGELVGTPGYMAPEQVHGHRDLDGRADLFAIGCVLYHCVTGRPPFDGDKIMTILAKLLLEEPPPVRSLRADVPPRLERLIDRLLAKRASDRPASAEEVADELAAIEDALERDDEGALLSSGEMPALTVGAADAIELHRPGRHRRVLAWVAAAAGLITAGGTTWGLLARVAPASTVAATIGSVPRWARPRLVESSTAVVGADCSDGDAGCGESRAPAVASLGGVDDDPADDFGWRDAWRFWGRGDTPVRGAVGPAVPAAAPASVLDDRDSATLAWIKTSGASARGERVGDLAAGQPTKSLSFFAFAHPSDAPAAGDPHSGGGPGQPDHDDKKPHDDEKPPDDRPDPEPSPHDGGVQEPEPSDPDGGPPFILGMACAYWWLGAYQECASSRLSADLSSQKWVDINYECWGGVAKKTFDTCCAEGFDEACAMHGMDWKLPEAGDNDKGPIRFETNERCLAAAGVSPEGGNLSAQESNVAAYCWQVVAGSASERYCSRHPESCDTDDLGAAGCFTHGWWTEGEHCVSVLFATQDRCLADANVSMCDARASAEETIARCWKEGVAAKAACCATTPDWTCGSETH